MRRLASCCLLVAACGRIGFDETAPGGTVAAATGSLTAGGGFTCTVRAGAVWCWGASDQRQLGIDTLAPQPLPVQAMLPVRAVRVAANDVGACALDEAGAVWCWGAGALPAQQTGLPRAARSISLGGGHACAILDDASLWCWGKNDSGEAGVDPAMTVVAAPVQVLATAQDVAAGGHFTCALKTDASVWCWGNNDLGTLGDGTTTSRFTPAPVPGLSATAIAAGGGHACALDAAGRYRCWGSDPEGQLGIDPPQQQLSPAPASSQAGFVAIAAGATTTCAIDGQAAAWCWGNGNNGEQGDGYRYDHPTPGALGVTDVIAIVQGDAHGCLEHSDHTIACWGYGSHGELGDGRLAALVPRKVPLPGAANWVVAGRSHACAMLNGATWCWGSNGAGELGFVDSTNAQSSTMTPTQVAIGSANGVWAGDEHTCALVGGNVWCWGRNDAGQAGSLPLEYMHPPTMVAGLAGNNGASCAGEGFSCTSNASGMFCWGADDFGQLGDGGGAGGVTPVLVGTGIQPACGYASGCAKIAGGVGCWGYNSNGQLGIGTQDASLHMLAPVVPNTPYAAVATGDNHACAIRGTTGTVDCWGNGDSGQLGDGAMTSELQPVAVAGLASQGSIAAGGDTTCAADASTIHCWGLNDVGQVGDGTTINRGTPTTTQVGNAMPAVGSRFACGLSGTDVYCWGDNDDGQIGSGPQTRALSPVNVAFP